MAIRNPAPSVEVNAALADLLGVERPAIYFDRANTDAGLVQTLELGQQLARDRVRPFLFHCFWDGGTAAPGDERNTVLNTDVVITQVVAFLASSINITSLLATAMMPTADTRFAQFGPVAFPGGGAAHSILLGRFTPPLDDSFARITATNAWVQEQRIFLPKMSALYARLFCSGNPAGAVGLIFHGWEQRSSSGRFWLDLP